MYTSSVVLFFTMYICLALYLSYPFIAHLVKGVCELLSSSGSVFLSLMVWN